MLLNLFNLPVTPDTVKKFDNVLIPLQLESEPVSVPIHAEEACGARH